MEVNRMRRYSLVCDDRHAEQIEELAIQYNLTEQEVLRQLVDAGLDTVDSDRGGGRGGGRRGGRRGGRGGGGRRGRDADRRPDRDSDGESSWATRR